MATAALNSPPHNRNYSAWGRRLAIFLAILAALTAAYFIGRRFLFHPEQPPRPVEAASMGMPYPTPTKVAATLPRPDRGPATRAADAAKDTVKPNSNSGPPQDAILNAAADFKNTNEGGSMRQGGSARAGGAVAGTDGENTVAGNGNEKFSENFRAGRFPTAKARTDPHSLYTISAGRTIHCNTETWINSQLRGFFSCVLPHEIRNDYGTVMLLPAGTHVVGQIQGGVINGQDRLMAIFSEIRTSDYPQIKIAINSPAADALGAAGITGTVNDFFWSNFFATAVYAILDAGPLLLTNALNNNSHNGGNVTEFNQITTPETSLAGRMLERRLQRQPVLDAAPGKDVTIFVNQDIDCSTALELRLRGANQAIGR
jgi:type IV secretion system protein VirB10